MGGVDEYPTTPTKKFPADHDPYSVDPELLARKDYFSFGVGGPTNFDGNFYSSEQFQKKVSDVREAYNRPKDNKTTLSSGHGSGSPASNDTRLSRAKNRERASTSRSVISPVESTSEEC